MTCVLIVDTKGSIKEHVYKNYDENDLYKKAGFKTDKDFKLHHTFEITKDLVPYRICLFAKSTGKANSENKYEFPPPVDNILFFGNCILVSKNVLNQPINFNTKLWNEISTTLFGGFDDIDDDDIDDDDDDDDDIMLTKDGYFKDDLISGDYSDISNENDSGEDVSVDYVDSEDEVKPVLKQVKKLVEKKPTKVPKKIATNIKKSKIEIRKENDNYLGCEIELTTEEYFKS